MVTKETKIELTNKLNGMFRIVFGLLGGIISVGISEKYLCFLFGVLFGLFSGWGMQPYNKEGELRY